MNSNGIAEPPFEMPVLSLLFRHVVWLSPLPSPFEIPAVILKADRIVKIKASDPGQYDQMMDRQAYLAALKG